MGIRLTKFLKLRKSESFEQKMKKKHFLLTALILLSFVFRGVKAQAVDEKENARIFVQKFYDWYNAMYNADSLGNNNTPDAEHVALTKRANYFDARLLKAIKADNLAQSKADEIVGLEMDPFLAAQDVGFSYQTGDVRQSGNKYLIDIHCDRLGKSRKAVLAAEVAIIAEVTKLNGQWIFTNFTYPDKNGQSNLVQILKNLRNDRVKWAAENQKKRTKN